MAHEDAHSALLTSIRGGGWASARGYLADFLIFAIATAGAAFAVDFGRGITAVLLYLTGVVVIGGRSGLWRGMLAALTASFIYNFFLSDPRFRLGVTTVEEVVPLIAFNLSALISGGLAGRLQDALRKARQAERRNELMLAFSDDLQRAVTVDDVVEVARKSLTRHGLPITSLLIGTEVEPQRFHLLPPPSGDGRSRPAEEALRIELVGSNGVMGAVAFGAAGSVHQDYRADDLRAAANLLMIALDRCLLLEKLSDAIAVERSEKLKDALLSSVSHDLRTPLTAIEAAATSLRSFRDQLSARQQDRMLDTVTDQCAKLNRLTSNLLDMGRIQAGIRSESFDKVDVADILSVALASVRTRFPSQQFMKEVTGREFWVLANESMLEQILVNVLENAVLHGASDEPIHVKLEHVGDRISLRVRDFGPGVEEPARAFARFYRGSNTARRQGSGLGLHIAQGFTEAFGGTIKLQNAEGGGGGAIVTVTLPTTSR